MSNIFFKKINLIVMGSLVLLSGLSILFHKIQVNLTYLTVLGITDISTPLTISFVTIHFIFFLNLILILLYYIVKTK